MNIKIVYYLDTASSWCYWAEPAWAELKRRYANAPVEFSWKIALLDENSMSKSRAQCDWFYRRSGTITRSPFMLHSGWLDPVLPEFLAPNCVAEAAKDLGVADDRVRLALMEAAMREGKKVADWNVSAGIAAKAAGLNESSLLAKARSAEIEQRVRASTAEFHALKVTQRPTFVLESNIGDRAVFSGCWRAEPLIATIEGMLSDATAYASWKTHIGDPPQS
ncbi:MAG TPA: DsbA family protein [Verrucomicrobiae bacterium]|jgi:predicted DsbA family dithiol-disulfide isomerase|nr:DsbA family protein [Verrucomicrobiae bacterium]